jgi:hypothetical protein
MAVDTIVRALHFGRVIPFGIETMGEHQNVLGAILNTVTAAFAAFLDDVHDSSGNKNLFDVQRRPPEFHGIRPSMVFEL